MGADDMDRRSECRDRVPDIVIITGLSGSGRTQAMHVFEDMGYFCIDNLPPRLVRELAELVGINAGVGRHLAVTCDLRSQGLFDELLDVIAALEEHVGAPLYERGNKRVSLTEEGMALYDYAKAIVELAGELGVKLTPAGAPWPYGADPAESKAQVYEQVREHFPETAQEELDEVLGWSR